MSIRIKALLSFLLVIYGILFAITFVNISVSRTAFLNQIVTSLGSQATDQKIKLELYLKSLKRYDSLIFSVAESKNDSEQFSNSSSIEESIQQIVHNDSSIKAVYLTDLKQNSDFKKFEMFRSDELPPDVASSLQRFDSIKSDWTFDTLGCSDSEPMYVVTVLQRCVSPNECSLRSLVIRDATSYRDLLRSSKNDSSTGILITKNDTETTGVYLCSYVDGKFQNIQSKIIPSNTHDPSTSLLTKTDSVLSDRLVTDYRGKHVIAATKYLSDGDFGFVLIKGRSEALQEFTNTENIFYITLNVLAIVASIIVLFVSRKITIPIEKITQAALFNAQGLGPKLVKHRSNDELGVLAVAFNKMTADLTDLNRNLEAKVESRTHDLEEAASREKAINDGIGEGVIVLNIDLVVQSINTIGITMINCRYEDVIGKYWPDIVEPTNGDNTPEVRTNLPESISIRSGTVETRSIPRTLYYKKKTGERFPVTITSAPFKRLGIIHGAVVVFRDISQEKSIDTAKTEFVSLASHQLRTPLTAIGWYVDALLKGNTGAITDMQKDFLSQIDTSNKQMIALVGTLLSISRIELGTFHVHNEPIILIDTINTVVKELTSLCETKRITTEIHNDYQGAFQADPALWKCIVQNIVSNAVKYSIDSSTVEIYLKEVSKGEFFGEHEFLYDSLVFIVKNQGIGIPETEKARIFSKMYRAKNAQQYTSDGNGLGLYLVRQIIIETGGKIWFESENAKETSFYVIYPARGMASQNVVI